MPTETITFSWIPKHSLSAVIAIPIALVLAIIGIMIVLFKIYKTSCKHIGCHKNSSVITGYGNDTQGVVEFSLEELKQATNNFGENHLMTQGGLEPIYIGLIQHTIVTIKRLSGSPRFLVKVIIDMSKIRHGNVVDFLGYCFENGHQILMVYEHLFNGNMRDYLCGSNNLNFKRRISIALGAAKGLQYLHNLNPSLAHNNFKMTNVLLDSKLNAKVSYVGLSPPVDVDHDLEVGLEEDKNATKYDVFCFGLFLLELITNSEPKGLTSTEGVLQWIESRVDANTFVDKRMNGSYTREAFEVVITITLKCLRFPVQRRPRMDEVVTVLENILIYEDVLTGFTPVSELFAIII